MNNITSSNRISWNVRVGMKNETLSLNLVKSLGNLHRKTIPTELPSSVVLCSAWKWRFIQVKCCFRNSSKTAATMKKNKTVLRMDQSYVVIPYQNPLVGIQMTSMQTAQRPIAILPKPEQSKQDVQVDVVDLLPADLDLNVEQLVAYGETQQVTMTTQDLMQQHQALITPQSVINDIDPMKKEYVPNIISNLMSDRCRMCAERKKILHPIFGPEGKLQDLAEKMSKFLYINVREDDRLPLGMCGPCITKLQASHDLAVSCASAQSKLNDILIGQYVDDCEQPSCPMESPDNDDWCNEKDELDSTDPLYILPEMPAKCQPAILSKRRKTSAAPLRCTQCLISFSTYEEISSHYLMEHDQHMCTTCNFLFKSNEELNDHLETHKDGGRIIRRSLVKVKPDIKKQTRTRKQRKTKQKVLDSPLPITFSETKEGKKVYECSKCGKSFNIRCRFITHILRHSGQRKTECQVCHKMFFNNDDLRNHMTTHNKSQKYTCEICSREFNCKRYLNVHFQKVHNKEWYYKCKLCEDRFVNVPDIEKHIEINHKNVFSNMEDRYYIKMSDYQCHICNKYSSNRYNLQDHIQMHKREGTDETFEISKEKQFQCEKCAKMFASKTSLSVHLQIHAGDKPLQCQYCPKRFLYKQSLDQHEMIHVGNRPYKCKTCPKSYVHISALKTHVKKVHLNLRPFVCEFCNKGFPRKGNLNVHLRIHTGVRPFSCRYCERDFTQKQEMQRHELTHTNDTLYKCNNKCGFGSNKRKTVSEHEATCGYICNTIQEQHNTDGDVNHFLILH